MGHFLEDGSLEPREEARLSEFGSHVESVERVHVDTGVLAVTSKHVYFRGEVKAFRVRLDKIVAFTPYSDGIAIHRDAITARSQAFRTGDGWFTYNLLVNAANLP